MANALDSRLVDTFVELADTLVTDFDVIDFVHVLTRRATELLDVAEAGLLLATGGTLHLMAFSSERTRSLELFQLRHEEGPCLECYRTRTSVIVEDLDAVRDRWPGFVREAHSDGFASVHALPLRLRNDTIGVLGLFGAAPGRLNAADLRAGQAMADIATVGILQQRALHEARARADQLQFALNSRIVIEQAKGVLAQRAGIEIDEAFHRLRHYARNHNRRITEVAQEVIDGALDAAKVAASRDGAKPPLPTAGKPSSASR